MSAHGNDDRTASTPNGVDASGIANTSSPLRVTFHIPETAALPTDPSAAASRLASPPPPTPPILFSMSAPSSPNAFRRELGIRDALSSSSSTDKPSLSASAAASLASSSSSSSTSASASGALLGFTRRMSKFDFGSRRDRLRGLVTTSSTTEPVLDPDADTQQALLEKIAELQYRLRQHERGSSNGGDSLDLPRSSSAHNLSAMFGSPPQHDAFLTHSRPPSLDHSNQHDNKSLSLPLNLPAASTTSVASSSAAPSPSPSPSPPSPTSISLKPGRVIIAANRLPLSFSKSDDGKWTTRSSSGGLVSAMTGVKGLPMVWVGWPGADIDAGEHSLVTELCTQQQCHPVFLPPGIMEDYYNGFCNGVLWPLFHYMQVPIEDSVRVIGRFYEAYKVANQSFADAILDIYQDGDMVWIHDYHLMLVPLLLRQARPKIKLGWFCHTTFPASETYRNLVQRAELLQGVLACDLIGFHIYDYARHFKSCCTRIAGLAVTHAGIDMEGRFAAVGAFPIGIDADRFVSALDSSEVKAHLAELETKFAGKKLVLGIDRLDYVKGIPHKLYAMERLLQQRAEWRGKVVLVQIAVPSREQVPEYQRLKTQVHQLVGEINGQFGTLDYSPIQYLDQHIPFDRMCALYMRADVCLVTSLRDGMNLVSYEYVVCQRDRHGVLVLSEFCGASQSLGAGAITVNPWDVDEMANAVHTGLSMPEEEREQYSSYLFQHVTTYTAQTWANSFINELNEVTEVVQPDVATAVPVRLPSARVLKDFSGSTQRVIILGFEGVLSRRRPAAMSHQMYYKSVKPSRAVVDSIRQLASNPHTTVIIDSSAGRSLLERLFGSTGAWLIAENGFYLRKTNQDWQVTSTNVDVGWMDQIEPVFMYFKQRTPGSFVERGESFLSFHYGTDDEWAEKQAYMLLVHLMGDPLSSHGFEVVHAHKLVQVRPLGVSKGQAVDRLLKEVSATSPSSSVAALTATPSVDTPPSGATTDAPSPVNAAVSPPDFVLSIGDYIFKDEDVFLAASDAPLKMVGALSPSLSPTATLSPRSRASRHRRRRTQVADSKCDHVFTSTIGKNQASIAEFYVHDCEEVEKLLGKMASICVQQLNDAPGSATAAVQTV